METYPRAAVERAMKIQEVIMRAMAKKVTWEKHDIRLSYKWVKRALQMAGLVKKSRKRGVHRRRRPRRPLPGMLLHLDGSSHSWFQDDRRVEEESTPTVMTARREVIERKPSIGELS